jgi:uncharacterized protein
MTVTDMEMDRRGLLKSTGLGAFALSVPLGGLMESQAQAAVGANGEQISLATSPYGPVAPVNDLATGLPLLQLPSGFTYRSISWRGDMMSDGQRVSPGHDGMGVVQVVNGRTVEHVLIRNHELGVGTQKVVVGNPGGSYSPFNNIGGGCSVLRVRNGQLVDHRQAIAGTAVNCAGGVSLWGSWLTCEETNSAATASNVTHGYVFDVNADPSQTVAQPLVAMGRFPHEATASDPVTGYVYMTEDLRPAAGFYRFKPNSSIRAYGELAKGGTLQMAKVIGVDKANLLALAGVKPSDVSSVGQVLQIEWVDINTPDASATSVVESGANNPRTGTTNCSGPFAEGRGKGGLRMSRGEGIWWDAKSSSFYITDTAFGYNSSSTAGNGLGCVWAYKPSRSNPDIGTLTLIYASSTSVVGNNPDNITVSPKGGVIYFEDGGSRTDDFGLGMRMMGLTAAGEVYILAKNNVQLSSAQLTAMGRTGHAFYPSAGDYRSTEFAGGTFDPTGRVLYVNLQSPGITFAITGPWARGNL